MGDFTRLTRTDWLGLADRFYARLDGTLASLNGPDWERVTPYLGFRARDVLAHMASTIPVNFREVLDRALAGNPAAPPEFDTFARNTREVARRRATPPAALLTEFRRELDAIMGMYRRMSDADWEKPAWFFVGRGLSGPRQPLAILIRNLGANKIGKRLWKWEHGTSPKAQPAVFRPTQDVAWAGRKAGQIREQTDKRRVRSPVGQRENRTAHLIREFSSEEDPYGRFLQDARQVAERRVNHVKQGSRCRP